MKITPKVVPANQITQAFDAPLLKDVPSDLCGGDIASFIEVQDQQYNVVYCDSEIEDADERPYAWIISHWDQARPEKSQLNKH